MLPKINTDTFQGEESPEELPDILLVPFTARIYLDAIKNIKEQRGYNIEPIVRISSTIMYRYSDSVLASTIKGKYTPFKIFETMDFRIYIFILLSVFIMSLVVAIPRVSINVFFSNLWSHLSIILSDNYSVKSAVMSTADRLMIGVWLMSCTVLLAAFSGLIRELMIKPKPIYWIDSLDDLAEWKHLTIWTTSATGLSYYLTNFRNESMAQNFVKRIVVLNNDLLSDDPKRWDNEFDYNGVKDGKVAIVGDLFYSYILKQNLISRYGMIEDLDFHISKSDDLPSQPSFIVTMTYSFNDYMASILNLV